MSSTTFWRRSDRNGQVSHAGAESATTRMTGRIFSTTSAYFSAMELNEQPALIRKMRGPGPSGCQHRVQNVRVHLQL